MRPPMPYQSRRQKNKDFMRMWHTLSGERLRTLHKRPINKDALAHNLDQCWRILHYTHWGHAGKVVGLQQAGEKLLTKEGYYTYTLTCKHTRRVQLGMVGKDHPRPLIETCHEHEGAGRLYSKSEGAIVRLGY